MQSATWPRLAVAVGAGLLLTITTPAEETQSARSFATEAAAITVDVLALDDDGQPVRGLTKSDFVILEDGRPQTIVGFQTRDSSAETAELEAAVLPEVASNEPSDTQPGRVLALLIDDLGISAATMGRLKTTLAEWIRRRADPRDEITIITTGGGLWWSDTVARGRDDLLAILARVEGKRLAEPQNSGGLSTWEAYQISVAQPGLEPQKEGGEFPEPWMPGAELEGNPIRILGESMLARVMQRWYDQKLCVCVPHDCNVRACMNRVQLTARETHTRWAQRAQGVLTTLSNLSRSLASVTGRKSILLVSEEFLQDDSLGRSIQAAIAALHRSNTSVYFLGALGLTAGSTFSAEQEYKPRSSDILGLLSEQTTFATAGAVALAEATGGVAITSSNDLAAGLDRMALDASAYYLLGYQPEKPPDGKWRKLEVKVSRPGVKVRARQRYFAERVAEKKTRATQGKLRDVDNQLSKRELPPTLLTGSARGALPLRLGAYVQETDHAGQARVQLAIEIDNSRVQVDRAATPWRATLDLTVLVAGLNRAPLVPVDEQLKLSLEAKDVGNGWWLVPREVWLPSGVAQIRVFARDTLSKIEGVVTERLVVPGVDQPYLSTPVLTDRTLPPPKAGEPPRLVPTAQRRFGRERPLLCQYEVFAFGGRTLEGVPQLVASYTLQRGEGQIVSSDQPTPIETDGFHAIRRITLPAERLEDGAYLLVVRVDDRLAQRTLTARAPFVIEGGQPSSGNE